MRTTQFVRRALTLVGAAGLGLAAALPASASPGIAATTSGWRVVKTLGPFKGTGSPPLTALSASDAWYTWSALGFDNKVHDYVLHWNGTTWQSIPIPGSLDSTVQSEVTIGATSAKDFWLISAQQPTSTALRWNGHSWYKQAIPKGAIYGNLSGGVSLQSAFFSPTNIWLFSEGQDKFTNPDHYAVRYNGHSWSKVSLPLLPFQVSAVSPTDIWVLGRRLSNLNSPVLAHWDGHTWHALALPPVNLPKNATGQVADITAVSATNVWAVQDESTPTSGRTMYLLHWNGKSWYRVFFKYATSYAYNITPDGHGGIWTEAWGPQPANQPRYYHVNAGVWTEYIAGTQNTIGLLGIYSIPGTRSLWGAAEKFSGKNVYAEILKFGQ